jgi:RNA polymerase sigma-70 factor, ECF subfamily
VHRDDAAIIKEVLAGDKRAYGALIDRHKDKAMTLAIRMLKNRQEAEEAVQDAFVRAFNALPRFEWKSSFSTWFYRIVYNVCATQLSRRGEDAGSTLALDDESTLAVPSDDPPPDIQYESVEFEQIVLAEIEKLPATYSAVCTLFFLHDMSYDQIVEVTGMPLGTVKVKLFRGRMLLREGVVRQMGVPSSAT